MAGEQSMRNNGVAHMREDERQRDAARPNVARKNLISWRTAAAYGMHHTGMLRGAHALSSIFERQPTCGSGRPKWRRVTAPRFLILCYHRVGVGGVPIYSELAPSLFEAQMLFLKKRYRIVSLDELCRELQEPSTRGPAVAITFDDGYADLYQYALPILSKYAIPATVYLVSEAVETGQITWYDRIFLALQAAPNGKFHMELDAIKRFELNTRASRIDAALEIVSWLRKVPNDRRLDWCRNFVNRVKLPRSALEGRMLNWEQARQMQDAGISFGSHTVSHPVMSRLTHAETSYELSHSKLVLESNLGKRIDHFAFPFGHQEDCGSGTSSYLAQSGYRSAVTTVGGINVPGMDPFSLRRVQIGDEHTVPWLALRLCQSFWKAELAPLQETRLPPRDAIPPVGADSTEAIEGSKHA